MTTDESVGSPDAAFTRYANWYDQFNLQKDYEAEIRYILRQVESLDVVPRRWLDIGCGTGHHLSCLKEAGIDVEGVDRSPAMIARAKAAHPQIPFVLSTVQDLHVGGDRDIISMLFHVMSYLESDAMIRAALERIAPRLSPSGVFVFDFWHTDAVVRDPPGRRIREAIVDGRKMFRLSMPIEDRQKHLISVQYEFRWDLPGGPLVHAEAHTMRHFNLDELTMFLREAELDVVRCEGWMSGRELSASDWYGCIYARRR